MAEPAFLREAAVRASGIVLRTPRHSVSVRLTHWIVTLAFFALLISGIAILIAHPRLYWGEAGGFGGPSLLDLPLPFSLGHSGWGRSLHFLSAWVCVLTGLVYLLSGFLTQHFSKDLLPSSADLAPRALWRMVRMDLRWSEPAEEEMPGYNSLQRLAYLAVVFALFPLMVLSGLAMSPAIASVVPQLVEAFGGQQSARTVHFFVACLLVLFVIAHVAMVCRRGFVRRMKGMIAGSAEQRTVLR